MPADTDCASSTFAGTVVKILYGFDVSERNDPFITTMEKVMEGLQAFTPGRYLVESLPIIRFIPGWMPGAGFQKDFAGRRSASERARADLYNRMKQGLVSSRTQCLGNSGRN